MLYRRCPKQEALFEFVSIPRELSLRAKFGMKLHLKSCKPCAEKISTFQKRWEALFTPEPEVMSSLLRVYSKLQNDETLVLKGWKLNDSAIRQRHQQRAALPRWLFHGGVAVASLSIMLVAVSSRFTPNEQGKELHNAMNSLNNNSLPYAQIRIADKNRVKVHYVKPELLQTIEFETTGQR